MGSIVIAVAIINKKLASEASLSFVALIDKAVNMHVHKVFLLRPLAASYVTVLSHQLISV